MSACCPDYPRCKCEHPFEGTPPTQKDIYERAIEAQRKDKYLLFTKPNRDGSRKKFVRAVMYLKRNKPTAELLDECTKKYGDEFVRLFAKYICIDESEETKKATMQIAEDFIAGKIVVPKLQTNG